MRLNLESINRSLVNEYIRSAHGHKARGNRELLALEYAAELNRIGMHRPTYEIYAAAAPAPKESETLEVLAWHALILREIHAAICLRDKKYRREVSALRDNGRLLIAAVAGYVAASLGVVTAVIAALVAAILRLVVAMGTTVFCKKLSAIFPK